MAIHIIKMPDIGEGIAEVELVEWHVNVGDAIAEDQVLADVMTDKATVQVPSPVHGKVLALGGSVGEVMAVGSELIRIDVLEEDGAPEQNQESPSLEPSGATPVAARAHPGPGGGAPAPASLASALGAASSLAQPTAPAPDRPAAGAPGGAGPGPARPGGGRALASPAVRKRAWDLGISLQYVPGSGSAGRISHGDLDAWLARERNETAERTTSSQFAPRHDRAELPLIGMRRRIAQKMQESKRRIPHFSYVEELDVTELEELRARLNTQFSAERGKLTMLPFLIRAMVLAVREHPQVNATYDDQAEVVTQYGAVHVGIAAQTPAGLMVPVLRHAETLDLWSCAAEIARLAQAARAGKAARDELSGSTITLTSLGALGGVASTPVINHPEVAIVGTNRILERPIIVNGQVVARKLMNLSSSFDHRVVDGMHAAEFIQTMRRYLEYPALLFVE